MKSLMQRVLAAATAENATRVTAVSVRLGALSHIADPAHFIAHFQRVAAGTIAEGAAVHAHASGDIRDPAAADIVVTDVEVEL